MLLRIPRLSLLYDTICKYFWLLFLTNQLHIALSTFSSFPQRVFLREEFILFFPNEAVNLCLLLTHVETVFRGTPYFVATSLTTHFFKALLFSAKGLFVSFRLTGAIFVKETSDKKLKTFLMYFITKKSNKTIEL